MRGARERAPGCPRVQPCVVGLHNRAGPWELIAIAGHHRVRDRKVPRGVAEVRYRVRARRSTGKTSSWSNTAEVSFGCGQCDDFAAAPGFGEPSPPGERGAA